MIQASELRIGNCVGCKYDNNNYILASIIQTETDIFDIEILDSNGMFSETHIEDLEPIPLTEDWHNKFGVKKDGFDAFRYKLPRKNNMNVLVIFQGDYVFLRQGRGNKKEIDDDVVSIWNMDLTKREMFVHEWQNLYFALCGTEIIKETGMPKTE